MAKPIIISKIPERISIFFICFEKDLKNLKLLLIKIEESKKGIANPREKISISQKEKCLSVAESVRMLARMGPTHGLHPKEKLIPSKNGDKKDLPLKSKRLV